ncbi:MAG: AI-2E family transporter [Bacillota bacterium]
MANHINDILGEVVGTGKDWLKSHTIIAAVVFVMMLIALSIVNYAVIDFGNFAGIFFIALGLAILDFLPVVGLMVPMGIWAACSMLIYGNTTLGIAVIVVCLVVSVLKQVLEPFIVGKTMGISPLEEVLSALAVFAVTGFNPLGLILGPILYTVIKVLYKKYTGKELFFRKKTG